MCRTVSWPRRFILTTPTPGLWELSSLLALAWWWPLYRQVSLLSLHWLSYLCCEGVLWKYWNTPVVRACSRELSCVLIIGTFLSFSTTFIIVAKPSDFTCGVMRFLIGFCYTLCYAAVVTKTNRISRIFSTKSRSHPSCTSPTASIIISLLLTSVEVDQHVSEHFHTIITRLVSTFCGWYSSQPPLNIISREMFVFSCVLELMKASSLDCSSPSSSSSPRHSTRSRRGSVREDSTRPGSSSSPTASTPSTGSPSSLSTWSEHWSWDNVWCSNISGEHRPQDPRSHPRLLSLTLWNCSTRMSHLPQALHGPLQGLMM